MRLKNQDQGALREHMFATYIMLRYGLAALGFAFPLLLWLGGKVAYGIDLRPSMSHYYFAPYPDDLQNTTFPMRVWFVGLLFAIGVGLYLYKGFTNWENIALNLAGVFAVLVAVFPMNIACTANCGASAHGTFAILLFLCLAFVSIFCARATLDYLSAERPGLRKMFLRSYQLLGVLMLVSPLAALLLTFATNHRSPFIFFAEAFGVWSFAAYWWVKSREMALSRAESRALEGRVAPPKRQAGTILPAFSVEPSTKQAQQR